MKCVEDVLDLNFTFSESSTPVSFTDKESRRDLLCSGTIFGSLPHLAFNYLSSTSSTSRTNPNSLRPRQVLETVLK
jgi:hypothetical protein